ncbi:hypothetical protein JTB14_016458 [Gonioctena quinquepunctata]|nr:hypothetical protein JTB14_016458 [Gonioctena quinquepunctata]
MNSKKNKKNLAGAGKAVNSKTEGTATNEAPKKTKKKSAVIPNENGTIKQKTRKRKQPEVGSVTVKRSKRNGVDDGMDQSSICDDDQKSGEAGLQSQAESADKDISNEQLEKEDLFSNNVEENLQAMFGEIPSPKKGKKRSKDSPVILDDIEAELYDGLQKAPCTEQIEEASSKKKKKKIKQNDSHLTLEELESTLNNNKTVAKHEVNIVDIKDQNGKEGSENVVTISIQDGDSDWEENELLKQFEKDEKEESPKGRKTAKPSWPEDDLKELINRMEVCIPENDDKAFMRRIEELEWDTIAFKNYSVEDCKKTWAIIQKKVRRFRLLKEVLEDAGKLVSETKFKKTKAKKNRHPDMPRRPLSVYFIYYLTRREAVQAENPGIEATEVAKLCSQEFKSLPPEKKEKYEKAAQKNKEEYELKMEEFYQLHPEGNW